MNNRNFAESIVNLDSCGFIENESGGDGLWVSGRDGVIKILTPHDKKADFIIFEDKILVYVKSSLGYPAIYPLHEARFDSPAEAVLMDLDGTTVRSENFWIWIIEKTMAKLLGKPRFELEAADLPFVSGNSVSEHLQYCINKYCEGKSVEEARKIYFKTTNSEMEKIMRGRGRIDAFVPSVGLKDFLMTLKSNKIKIGLVTSGLYEKAWPEILHVFRTLKMGDPAQFYDAIITAGTPFRKGQTGTLGELPPKPHPWLYAEVARIGLGMDFSRRHKVIGIEDSAAGVLSVRLAGFTVIGLSSGNIKSAGMGCLLHSECTGLMDALEVILGKTGK
ncbi:MAG: HAD family hydrolase [Bacillota bacterium]